MKYQLGLILREMGDFINSGNTLLGSLDLGVRLASEPELKNAFQQMIEGWNLNQDIITPAVSRPEIFSPSAITLHKIGFQTGMLNDYWKAAGRILLLDAHFPLTDEVDKARTQKSFKCFFVLSALTHLGVPLI